MYSGGGRGIRTPGGCEPTAVFKTAALSRSAIPPGFKTIQFKDIFPFKLNCFSVFDC